MIMNTSSRRGYTLDLAQQTLTLSAAFSAAMNDPNSDEYKLVRQFQRDFPNLRIVRRTHATPTRYKNSDGTTTARNKHNGLTYERMERFISALPNSDEYRKAYDNAKAKAELMCASPYAAVSAWFMKQFPAFRTNPLFYLDNQPEIIDFKVVAQKMGNRAPAEQAASDEKTLANVAF